MNTNTLLTLGLLALSSWACAPSSPQAESTPAETIENPTNRVVLSSEIDWEQLNPARGDKSPQAGTVWGDRKGSVATGFLAKFVDGFSSPPHIHNVTYRAVVIKGLVHNDDPDAADMWMPPGSFWTQPKGEAHITSAQGEENIAYVEIDSGPYLVKPTDEAFDSGERPVNVDASNVLWLDASRTRWIDADSDAAISFLWERPDDSGLKGLFVKLPAGYQGNLHSDGAIFHAIMIQGELSYQLDGEEVMLDPTSYFGSEGRAVHSFHNKGTDSCVIYVRTNGELRVD